MDDFWTQAEQRLHEEIQWRVRGRQQKLDAVVALFLKQFPGAPCRVHPSMQRMDTCKLSSDGDLLLALNFQGMTLTVFYQTQNLAWAILHPDHPSLMRHVSFHGTIGDLFHACSRAIPPRQP